MPKSPGRPKEPRRVEMRLRVKPRTKKRIGFLVTPGDRDRDTMGKIVDEQFGAKP